VQVEMNAAHAIRRLEEAGFTHQQATGVVEVVQGEVLDTVATRDYVGEQIALVRKDLAEQIGAVRHELAEQIGAVREELAEQIGAVRRELAVEVGGLRTELADTRTELMRAIDRQTFWMNGFLAALLVAVLGLGGVVIGKL
jgi:small-conductance mechanosensitive channel